MSPRRVPPIQPSDLRDAASEERVERIWSRLEQDLAAVRVQPAARSSRTVAYLAAATFVAFGAGLLSGRVMYRDDARTPHTAVATHERAELDVFAAGSTERTYLLPGGGSITLQPGSMIELERAGAGDFRLRLLAGEASVDTAQAGASSLAIVSGAATIAAAPGSLVAVQKREDNLDVRVASGSAQVSSPAGTRALRKGEQMDGVPTSVTTTAVTPPIVRVTTPSQTARVARNDVPVAQVAVAPSWREHYTANRFDDAVTALKQQPGGIAGAIDNAKNAGELMMLSDVARWKGGDASEGIRALQLVADRYPSSPDGATAAFLLGKHYERAGQGDLAKKYLAQASQKGVLSEDAMCAQMLSLHNSGNKDEAAGRAKEYLGKYPNGRCKNDATRISAGGEADGEADPSESADPAQQPTPPAAAPSSSSTTSQ